MQILSKAIGVQIDYQRLDYNDISAFGHDFVKTYKWLNEVSYSVDIKALHDKYPEINWNTFEEWANRQYWNVLNEPIQGKII